MANRLALVAAAGFAVIAAAAIVMSLPESSPRPGVAPTRNTATEPAAPFGGGDCVLAADGSYIWMITRVEGGEYYALGWQGNGWGNEVHFRIGHFEALNYRPTPCPSVR